MSVFGSDTVEDRKKKEQYVGRVKLHGRLIENRVNDPVKVLPQTLTLATCFRLVSFALVPSLATNLLDLTPLLSRRRVFPCLLAPTAIMGGLRASPSVDMKQGSRGRVSYHPWRLAPECAVRQL